MSESPTSILKRDLCVNDGTFAFHTPVKIRGWFETEKLSFYRAYTDPFVTDADLCAAFALKEKLIPTHLYRFRPPKEYVLDEIKKRHVYLAPASEQTDKQDTTVRVSLSTVAQVQMRKNIDKLLAYLQPPATIDERLQIEATPDIMTGILNVLEARQPAWAAERNAKLPLKAFMEDFATKHHSELESLVSEANQVGMLICCFSETWTCPEMWEEFAKGSTGICIEYTLTGLGPEDNRRRYMYPVIYTDAPFDGTEDFLAKLREPNRRNRIAWGATMTKQTRLAKEREWRHVIFEGRRAPGRYVGMPTPTRIILGSQISEGYEAKVREAAGAHSIPVESVSLSPSTAAHPNVSNRTCVASSRQEDLCD